ncbi:MAG: hypothetical protein WAW37_15465 [Syntrophobacteraceae bacterium]
MSNDFAPHEQDGIPTTASACASEGLSTVAYLTGKAFKNVSPTKRKTKKNNKLATILSLPIIRTYEGAQLVELEGIKFQPEKRPGGIRGPIKDFSKESRHRLMRRMAKINQDEAGLPDFLHLTYPAEWSQDWWVWKRDLDTFLKAVIRKWPDVWGPWRLEFQERGAPHFHLLLWDGPGVEGIRRYDRRKRKVKYVAVSGKKSSKNKEIFDWISGTWYRVVGSGDKRHLEAGTKIEPIETWRGVVHYVSKYLAKLPDGNFVPVDYTGRFWGVIQKDRWKIVIHEDVLPEAAWFRVRRVLEKRRRSHGAKKRKLWESTPLSTYMDGKDSDRLIKWALESLDDPGRRAPF